MFFTSGCGCFSFLSLPGELILFFLLCADMILILFLFFSVSDLGGGGSAMCGGAPANAKAQRTPAVVGRHDGGRDKAMESFL